MMYKNNTGPLLLSYVAFIDLIKAFDSVPRAALWKVLLKFGFPRHFVRVVMRLHTGAVMKFKINDQAEDADVAEVTADLFCFSSSCRRRWRR